jgi:hypothetical protein
MFPTQRNYKYKRNANGKYLAFPIAYLLSYYMEPHENVLFYGLIKTDVPMG